MFLKPIARPFLYRLPLTFIQRCLATEASNFNTAEQPPVLEYQAVDKTTSQFFTSMKSGFLPRQDPLVKLPAKFDALEDLLQRMPIKIGDKRGLLAEGKFGDAVLKELPYIEVNEITDTRLLTALFRDYTFATSAYVLEPCDIMYRQKKDYGKGRDRVPKQLAIPLVKIADKLGAKPFMEYAQSYSLYNYQKRDSSAPEYYENLDLIRKFSGLDSEHGFILVHVAMVRYTGDQVKNTLNIIKAAERGDRKTFNQGLSGLLETLRKINYTMDTMWQYCAPADYMKFRTFIMGTKNQTEMFPNGVVYEGVSDNSTFYRGESGANDSIIPTCDNLLQLTQDMPDNPLTNILRDFRTYRPRNHTQWLSWVEERSRSINVRGFAMGDSNSAVGYLALLDQVREFRDRHWRFAKSYIIAYTNHPVATGGSPIITWLPNQLAVVLGSMASTAHQIDSQLLSQENKELLEMLTERAEVQGRILTREVEMLKGQFKDQDLVNETY
ncbi:Indoleamine 2,3-dioxygenase 1 [Neolecta irregularis DAH-3]|uniref:Indoleamine 2,3-dioxygenase n=1 Tax=Neolecta irregularis (strain DAH-3) TaxID=1198029 RepID=A0A1U7LSS5_NEOID|nr:Indoleamine 2,3-dioxygenase 1 [Neolecta irregularis DAH-3]|eukprot:OLL25571.1 Indoleamine 2,3-dioxygenase 1 [Neolecta irregularis DAH-3]